MADYSGLPDPVLAQIQGGFAGVPQAMPSMDAVPDYGLDPTIQQYLTGTSTNDIYMHDPRGSNGPTIAPVVAPQPAPVPPPAPAPAPGPASGKTTMGPRGRNAIGEVGGFVGNEVAAPAEVASVTGGALPSDMPAVTPTGAAPDLAPVAIPQMTPQQAEASNKALAKKQAAEAAFAASPEGLQQQANQIRRDAYAQSQQAINDERDATVGENTAAQKAADDVQKQNAPKLAADETKLAQDQAYHRQLVDQYTQQVNDAANYKVNTDRHVGIGGLIAIALSGIGDALDHRHGPNTAAQIIDANIDKRINDEWAQKRALESKAGATKGLVDMGQGQVIDDRTQQLNDRAAMRLQVADAIDATARQYANPHAQAKATAASAELRAKAAADVDQAAARGVQARKDAQAAAVEQQRLGLESRAQNRADKQFAFEQQKWKDQLDLQKQALEAQGKVAQAKALQDQADKTQQEGVFDPRTGDGLLDPQGRAKMAKADALEAQARTLGAHPALQKTALDQAQQLRADAHFNNVYTIKDPTERGKVVENIGANQELVDIIGRAKQMLSGDPSSFDRDAWAGLKTDFESAKAEWIRAHGGKPSSREFEAIGDMFGSDPESFISRAGSRGKMEASLDELQAFAIGDATNMLHGHGIKDEWHPKTAEPGNVSLTGESAAERGEGATPGSLAPYNPFSSQSPLAKGTREAYHTIFGGQDVSPQEAAENAAPFTQSGLAPQDEQMVRGLMKPAGKMNDAEYGNRINTLSSLAQDPRTGPGVLTLLRSNPALYRDVVKTLPVGQQAALRSFDSALQGVDLPTIPGGK